MMYIVMGRLDATKFSQLDFIVNFGVPPDVKSQIVELIRIGASHTAIEKALVRLDPIVLLKLHKYFFWADKKLHAVFYIEDKDEISEDLLSDFRDEIEPVIKPKDKKGGKREVKKEDTGPKVIGLGRDKKLTQADLLTGGKKKGFISIKDGMDFPDLGLDEDDPFAALD
jgi:hypothetical protein